ncbi:four helix bundle protein [Pedobacter flavus]|uniref:Four helix bundle protein n=1 Tax=Pedobacter flavus TaxID=3113906 RepID=A0ABU7H0U9_9SPHI|nr:four helix bundle protein [Pedobacter sp. VNH31]MEE1884947.1 four helix bundle protein [Pedobacter sp. VNH31]
MAFKFQNLKVWQKSMILANDIHYLALRFPKDEAYVLNPQIRRAANSITLNIAEGSTGQSNKEFVRFLRYSLRSTIETVGCLFLAKERNYINESQFISLYKKCEEVLVMINGLIKVLESGSPKDR